MALHRATLRRARPYASYRRSYTQPHREDPTPSATRQSLNQYNSLRRPWLRVFLGAFLTYQVCYWGWEKMRMDEVVKYKREEVEGLEGEVERLTGVRVARE